MKSIVRLSTLFSILMTSATYSMDFVPFDMSEEDQLALALLESMGETAKPKSSKISFTDLIIKEPTEINLYLADLDENKREEFLLSLKPNQLDMLQSRLKMDAQQLASLCSTPSSQQIVFDKLLQFRDQQAGSSSSTGITTSSSMPTPLWHARTQDDLETEFGDKITDYLASLTPDQQDKQIRSFSAKFLPELQIMHFSPQNKCVLDYCSPEVRKQKIAELVTEWGEGDADSQACYTPQQRTTPENHEDTNTHYPEITSLNEDPKNIVAAGEPELSPEELRILQVKALEKRGLGK